MLILNSDLDLYPVVELAQGEPQLFYPETTQVNHLYTPDPPDKLPFECQKIAKNLTFFSKKNCQKFSFFQKNCQGNFFEKMKNLAKHDLILAVFLVNIQMDVPYRHSSMSLSLCILMLMCFIKKSPCCRVFISFADIHLYFLIFSYFYILKRKRP